MEDYIKIEEKNSFAQIRLGTYYADKKDYTKALKYLNKAKKDPIRSSVVTCFSSLLPIPELNSASKACRIVRKLNKKIGISNLY